MIAAGEIAAPAASVAAVAALWLWVYQEKGKKNLLKAPGDVVETATITTTSAPSTTSAACPTGANAGKYKKCNCIDEFDIIPHPIAKDQLEAQQAFLASIAALPAPTQTQDPWCIWMAFQHASPTAWCECDKGKSTFAVATATASNAGAVCLYTTAPGKTISVSTRNGKPTSSTPTTAADTQPTVSPGKPFCYGPPAPLGDLSKMADGVEKFCKGIKKDMIQTGFSTGPNCAVELPDGVWMEVSVVPSYQCPQEDLDTSYEKCSKAMKEAVDFECGIEIIIIISVVFVRRY
ncbi:MAG: hypothetical protein Q9213_005722 [Squamulea squamosa]